MKAERIQEEKDNRRKVEAENNAIGKEDYRQREPEQAREDQHILTQLATSNILEAKEAERTRKDEADEQRRQDELIEFEAYQTEKADKEEAEASGASGAPGAITRST